MEFIDIESQTSCFGPTTWTYVKAGKISDNLILLCNTGVKCTSFNIDTMESKNLPISIGQRHNYAAIPIVPFGESETKFWITGEYVIHMYTFYSGFKNHSRLYFVNHIINKSFDGLNFHCIFTLLG